MGGGGGWDAESVICGGVAGAGRTESSAPTQHTRRHLPLKGKAGEYGLPRHQRAHWFLAMTKNASFPRLSFRGNQRSGPSLALVCGGGPICAARAMTGITGLALRIAAEKRRPAGRRFLCHDEDGAFLRLSFRAAQRRGNPPPAGASLVQGGQSRPCRRQRLHIPRRAAPRHGSLVPFCLLSPPQTLRWFAAGAPFAQHTRQHLPLKGKAGEYGLPRHQCAHWFLAMSFCISAPVIPRPVRRLVVGIRKSPQTGHTDCRAAAGGSQ